MEPDEKNCPFCAETIKAAAVVCKYCGRDLRPSPPPRPPQPAQAPQIVVQTIKPEMGFWRGCSRIVFLLLVGCALAFLAMDHYRPLELKRQMALLLEKSKEYLRPRHHSRITTSEATAIAMLKSYYLAQRDFKNGRHGRAATNTASGADGYADNFRNLFYGNPVDENGDPDNQKNLGLISQALANAFRSPLEGTATVSAPLSPDKAPTPYEGYVFCEDPAITDWTLGFGLYAYPVKSGSTGKWVFWIGADGGIHARVPHATSSLLPPAYDANQSPLHSPDDWEAW